MDLLTKALYLFVNVVLPLVVGFLCRRQSKLDKDFFRRMILINICGITPFLSLLTLWTLPLNFSLIWLPFIGVMYCVVPGIAAYFRAENKFASELDKGSYVLSAMLSNTTVLGGLCAFVLYGEKGFAATQMLVMLQNVVMFSLCFPLAQYYYEKSVGGTIDRKFFSAALFSRTQLPAVGTAIGIALNLSGAVRPALAGLAVDPLVYIGAWTALVPIGHSIDTDGMRQYYSQLLDLLPIKFILTPAAAYVIASFLLADATIVNTVVILAAMPTAINTVIAVQLHKLNVHIATAAFVFTTAVFIVAVLPALLAWVSMR